MISFEVPGGVIDKVRRLKVDQSGKICLVYATRERVALIFSVGTLSLMWSGKATGNCDKNYASSLSFNDVMDAFGRKQINSVLFPDDFSYAAINGKHLDSSGTVLLEDDEIDMPELMLDEFDVEFSRAKATFYIDSDKARFPDERGSRLMGSQQVIDIRGPAVTLKVLGGFKTIRSTVVHGICEVRTDSVRITSNGLKPVFDIAGGLLEVRTHEHNAISIRSLSMPDVEYRMHGNVVYA